MKKTAHVSVVGDFAAVWLDPNADPICSRADLPNYDASRIGRDLAEGMGHDVGSVYVLPSEPAQKWRAKLDLEKRAKARAARQAAPVTAPMFAEKYTAPTHDKDGRPLR